MESASAPRAAIAVTQDTLGTATWQAIVYATKRSVFHDVAEYLGTDDVARWEAVDVATQNAFGIRYETGSVWQRCAESQFPECVQFVADERLYERDQRPSLLRCHALLRRANCARFCMINMNTVEEASFVEGKLRVALTFCGAYRSACSRDAHLLLGNFQFMRSATGHRFEFGLGSSPPIAGLPAGVLSISMFLDGNELVTSALYAKDDGSRPYRQAKHVRLTLNVWSCDQGFALQYQNVPLVLDGARRSSRAGRWENKSIPRDRNDCLTRSVLCVLTLAEDDGRTCERILASIEASEG
eukprot:TRINITY_DN17384_c0_g1_i1.p1 TRINITY_DN17384_c0_g1~~TRINITY_DN17384_c0_g1_i1.p1  ORF type:complete len:299 (-),score=33.19 TRINITY_DN17384_c0_g1_i1:161-1057(-)